MDTCCRARAHMRHSVSQLKFIQYVSGNSYETMNRQRNECDLDAWFERPPELSSLGCSQYLGRWPLSHAPVRVSMAQVLMVKTSWNTVKMTPPPFVKFFSNFHWVPYFSCSKMNLDRWTIIFSRFSCQYNNFLLIYGKKIFIFVASTYFQWKFHSNFECVRYCLLFLRFYLLDRQGTVTVVFAIIDNIYSSFNSVGDRRVWKSNFAYISEGVTLRPVLFI